ncbi:hypothetical protein AC249_AIPGENE12140 [Exaiptasia diaphana]|nr:hypothetical protein AC249_AIPGENE12140 [Exaiptasia diaphana]
MMVFYLVEPNGFTRHGVWYEGVQSIPKMYSVHHNNYNTTLALMPFYHMHGSSSEIFAHQLSNFGHLKASASLVKTTPFVLDIVDEEAWDRELNLPLPDDTTASMFDDEYQVELTSTPRSTVNEIPQMNYVTDDDDLSTTLSDDSIFDITQEMDFSLDSTNYIEVHKVQKEQEEDNISELNSSATLSDDSVFDITQDMDFSFDSTNYIEVERPKVQNEQEDDNISELNSSATLSDDSVFDITQDMDFSFDSTNYIEVERPKVQNEQEDDNISELNSSATLSDDSVFDITQDMDFSFDSTNFIAADTDTILSNKMPIETVDAASQVNFASELPSINNVHKATKSSRLRRFRHNLRKMNIFAGVVCSRIVRCFVTNHIVM